MLLSFRKQTWKLNDYPVVIRQQNFDPVYSAPRFKRDQYMAYVVNWGGLAGTGDTRLEALRELGTNFEMARVVRERDGIPLPRPGIRVPIEFAPQERVNLYPDLVEDFTRRILGFEWAWISDESTLWDFHTKETNKEVCAKIKDVYGVDVSDIESAKLSEILGRIAARDNSAEEISRHSV
jgi:hypothetical protein